MMARIAHASVPKRLVKKGGANITVRLKMLAVLVILLVPHCGGGSKAIADEVWTTSGFLSKHLTHNHRAEYRENNSGVGFEWKDWSAGTYTTSIDRQAMYGCYLWKPLGIGLAGCVIYGGYTDEDRVIPAFLPMAALEWRYFGVNILAMPPVKALEIEAAVALQLKGRW